MPDEARTYALNEAEVVAKVIDGEVIMIRLADGTFYTMDGVGAEVWSLLERRHETVAIGDALANRYAIPADQARADVERLVRELREELLIVPSSAPPSTSAQAGTPTAPGVYEAPRLAIFRDMGNLLALDPPTPGIDDLVFTKPKP
jgi:hypothetical protein